jgi:hypothetical protein
MTVVSVGDVFLERADVARLVGLTSEAIRDAAKSGKLIPDARTSRGNLYLRQTVERFCAERNRRRIASVTIEIKQPAEPVEVKG